MYSRPATTLAATFPIAWTVASSPNADPRIASGANAATAACSAVSAQPIPTPASANATPSSRTRRAVGRARGPHRGRGYQLLIAADIGPHTVAGPELGSHLEIALAVASGIADAALGLRAGLTELGLDFLPLAWETYDLALAGQQLGAAHPIGAALADPALRAAIDVLGGYDLTHAGTLHALDDGDADQGSPESDCDGGGSS